jgi:hypothetical protein
VDLDAITREVQEELRELADSRGINLQLAPGPCAKVSLSPGQLREALQDLFAWIIQNSAGRGAIETEISVVDVEARVSVVPSRLDWQYLQIKALEDCAAPGLLFAQAAKSEVLRWAVNKRLIESLGGRLEIVTEGSGAGCIRVRFPVAPPLDVGNLS